MPAAVIEDWDRFSTFLATQPLCIWAAQRKQEIADRERGVVPGAPQKNDNADLLAALSSMA